MVIDREIFKPIVNPAMKIDKEQIRKMHKQQARHQEISNGGRKVYSNVYKSNKDYKRKSKYSEDYLEDDLED